jgi:hypothetical protein
VTHWGPTYYEMTHKPTPEEIADKARSELRQAAFPNVSFTDKNADRVIYEWVLRRKSDGKIVTKLDATKGEVYEFGPMGHCPEGYETVRRTLWPEPWEPVG